MIGAGARVFTEAATALLSWQAHLGAGLRVSASSPTAGPGTVVVLGWGQGACGSARHAGSCMSSANRPRRGFAYGTLPGHPERGEEAFIIGHHPDGTVTFTITAFTRPATPLATAAGPMGRAIQRRLTARYLRALAGRPSASPSP